ncbi:MAG: hypothetical protein WB565_00150 [Acidimicrobiales bacterium]
MTDTVETTYDLAHDEYVLAQQAVGAAKSRATSLRQRVASGDGDVSAAELAAADSEAEYAALLASGKEQRLKEAGKAVEAARLERTLDTLTAGIPPRGDVVAALLDTLDTALDDYVDAVREYDGFILAARSQLESVPDGPRVRHQPPGPPWVDGQLLSKVSGDRRLVRLVLPALRALNCPVPALSQLEQLAQGPGSPIPTTTK